MEQKTHPVFDYLFQRYAAASNFKEATTTLTTLEITEELFNHTGDSSITPQSVSLWLSAHGYHYDSIGDLRLVWLLRDLD
jgi:hypothetical protein